MNSQEQAQPSGRAGVGRLQRLDPRRVQPYILLGQGLYYAGAGLWPLLHMPSFLKVTGPKTDLWLVRAVAVLVTVIGATLALAGIRRARGPEVPLLALGSAAGLTGIEVVYVARRRISPIYLGDALAELAIIAYWAALWLWGRAERR